jgi:hypothetical protein
MERRDFLIKSGMLITAATLSNLVKGNSFIQTKNNSKDEEKRRDDYKQFKQPILQVLAIGLHTPSAHNTQPFKFKMINDNEAELYIEETRLLPITDPPSRQIHISCGCFLELVRIGASLISHKAIITYFPQGNYAPTDFGKKPIATIKLIKDTVVEHPLAEYIFTRHTSRLPYNGDMIGNDVFEKMREEANPLFSKIIFKNNTTELTPYLQLFKDAMKLEANTLAANEETRKMWRFTDEEVKSERNGLTWEAQGMRGVSKLFAKKFVKNTQESWNQSKNIDKGIASFSKGIDSSKGIIYWVTETNTIKDWINCGHDIMNFWLVLTKYNLYCHPLNQAIQEFGEMSTLRTKLDNMMGIKEGQKIQMIIRIGKSDPPFVSYRKHVNDLLRS